MSTTEIKFNISQTQKDNKVVANTLKYPIISYSSNIIKINKGRCYLILDKQVHTLTWSPVTLSISSIRGTEAGSPQRCSSFTDNPSKARVNEKPLVLHPNICMKEVNHYR